MPYPRNRMHSALMGFLIRLAILCLFAQTYCHSFTPLAVRPYSHVSPSSQQSRRPYSKTNNSILLQSRLYNTVGAENKDDDVSPAAMGTGAAVLSIALPALGAELIDPLMTLVDTAFVGRWNNAGAGAAAVGDMAGADALAGMGNAAALITFSFYLFGFLTSVTTPLVASKRAAGKEEEAQTLAGQALSLAFLIGTTLTITLEGFQFPLLQVMGAANVSPETFDYATSFLSIRAFAAPAVLCITASTGVLRGYLDTKTSVAILVFANLLNLLLDVWLIVINGMGPTGAAIATTSAEWISALLFLGVLAGKLPSVDGELGKKTNDDETPPPSILPALSIPAWQDIQPLVLASGSVLLRSLSLQLALSGAAAMAARGGGSNTVDTMDSSTISAAASASAHQIGIQLWLLCSFICDALAAASQALVADALGRQSPKDVREVSKTVFSYSLGLGLLLAGALQLGSSTNLLLDFFTNNPSTQLELLQILPLIILAQPLNAFVFAADGVLQGASQFGFQAKAMALSVGTAVGIFAMQQDGFNNGGSFISGSSNESDLLVNVWSSLLVLQLMRGITSTWKIVEKDGPINLLARGDSQT